MMTEKKVQRIHNFINIPTIAALFFLLLTLVTAGRYGFFGDELYFIACAKHLDFGYVDHPPLAALVGFVSIELFGETVLGLRFLSGLAGALTVLISARIAERLGGGKFARSLAALLICCAAAFPALSSFYSMNPFDLMFCSLFFLIFIKEINAPSPRNWIVLGVILGIGLLNKYTFLALGLSLAIALVLSRQWCFFKSRGLYICCLIGLVFFLPHILWQIKHDWPTLEFMQNATRYKNLALSPIEFMLQLVLGLNPLTLPIWLSGLIYLFLSKNARAYRALGWTVIIFLLIYMLQNSKFYYVLPVFPLILAAGAIAVERLIHKVRIGWFKWVVVLVLIISGAILMPLAVPILPVDQFVTYSKTIGIWDYIKMEKGESEILPLHFIYRFGWEELVELVGETYNALPENERSKCAIYASWYGPAGAIDHFGKKYGLPDAICARNSYWFWGPRDYSGEIVLVVGYDEQYLERFFNEIEKAAYFEHPYAYNQPIYICKKPKMSIKEMWPKLKNFI